MNKKLIVVLCSFAVMSLESYAQRPLPKTGSNAHPKEDSSNSAKDFRNTFLRELVGSYQMSPATNGYHNGEITIVEKDDKGTPKTFIWKNQSGVSWHLYNRFGTLSLQTNADENPYFKQGEQWFQFVFKENEDGNLSPEPAGFIFNGELYAKQKTK